MLFQRVTRTDAEKVFVIAQNVSAATISAGGACAWLSGSSMDGVKVTALATATLSLFAGIAAAAIVDSAYGLVQVFGYNSATYVSNGTAGGTDIAAGDILVPVNAQQYVNRSTASNGTSGFIIAGEAFVTATTPAAATKKVFIRAL